MIQNTTTNSVAISVLLGLALEVLYAEKYKLVVTSCNSNANEFSCDFVCETNLSSYQLDTIHACIQDILKNYKSVVCKLDASGQYFLHYGTAKILVAHEVDCTILANTKKYFLLSNVSSTVNQAGAQRISGVYYDNKSDMDAYLQQMQKAKESDHRILGRDLDLFFLDSQLSRGMVFLVARR